MIDWDSQSNCLTSWQVPGWPRPLRFTGWGCEVGNWFGFFSQDFLSGIACQIERCQLGPADGARLGSHWVIKLPKAKFSIQTLDELVAPNAMIRKLTITNPSPDIAWIGDAVLRLVVPWEEGLVAELEQQEIAHQGTNFYYDTEEAAVSLRWPDGRRLLVQWLERPEAPLAMTPYLYVRDQPVLPNHNHPLWANPGWVIHARLLVDYPAALVFRLWRNPFVLWGRGFLGRHLVSNKRFKNLWRAGEWKIHKRSFLCGLWPLMPAQSLKLTMKIEAST